jgi:hypothetical protein
MNGGSINGGYLIAGWFLTEHLKKKMMGTGDTPMTSETSMMMVNGGSYYA